MLNKIIELIEYCANCDYINDTDQPCFNCGCPDKVKHEL